MNDYSDFLTLARERYSVRSFKADAVGDEVIKKILTAGQLAPTACNRQPQRILVINSAEGLEKLRKCTECHFNAPMAMLVCYDRDDSWKRSYDGKDSGDIDASIVTTHMMLEAAALGVGTTWVMYFIPEAVREEFSLPDSYEPVALLVMGYPSDEAKPYAGHTAKKSLEDTVSFNKFNI